MSKVLRIILITLLSLLTITLIVGLVILIKDDFKFDFKYNGTSNLVYDENITQEFNKIDIITESLDIEFVKSNDNIANVKIYDDDKNDVMVNVENETLNIKSDKKVDFCFFCFRNRKAIITLPEKMYNLVVDTKSGDITSEIDFNNVNIVSTSGDLKFNNITEAFIKVTSGDIKINEVDDLEIKSTSGDLDIDKVNKQLNIKTTSGDIIINNLMLTENSNIDVTSGDVLILNASDNIYYDTNVISGDVKINNNNRHADVEVKISAKSGDITVKN